MPQETATAEQRSNGSPKLRVAWGLWLLMAVTSRRRRAGKIQGFESAFLRG